MLWPSIGLLPDTYNCGLRMRRECRERFPRHRLQRKLLISDPGMHHGTCVTHVPWCMSGSVARGGGRKRFRHSRRMRNTQLYVSGKRPLVINNRMAGLLWLVGNRHWRNSQCFVAMSLSLYWSLNGLNGRQLKKHFLERKCINSN